MSAGKKKAAKTELEEQRRQWRRAAAAVIAATRRDKDVTQVELGRRMGWSHDTIASLEAGRKKIEFGDVVMAATALDEDPVTLIHRVLQWNVRGVRTTRR